MKISQNLEAFRLFAETMKESGKESVVIRATEASVSGSRRLQVSVASDDRAYAFFRSDEAKSANTRTRDIFFKAVAKEFGGEKFIPQSVKDAMTNFGGASDKPLTARRIVAICDAVIKGKAAFAQNANEVQPPAAEAEAPTTRLLPEEPKGKKIDVAMPLSMFADVVKDEKNPSAITSVASGFFSFFSFSAPKPKVFTIADGKLTYGDMPDDPDPKMCQQIRKNLVDAIYHYVLTKGDLKMDVIGCIFDQVKSSLLDKSVVNTPLRLDDPAVKDALNIFESLKLGKTYNDSVSKNVLNRGTLKVNTAVLFDRIVAPALSKVLGDKNIALFSKAKATIDNDGYLSVTFDNARIKKEWDMLSKIDDVMPNALKFLVGAIKDQVAKDIKDLTLKVKPEYDAKILTRDSSRVLGLASGTLTPTFDEFVFKCKDIEDKHYLSTTVAKYVLAGGSKGFKTSKETDLRIARPLLQSMHKMHRAGVDNYVTYNKEKGVDGIRRLAPRECLRLMGFRDDFDQVVSDTATYMEAGNSIVVDVLIALLKQMDITKYGRKHEE